MNKSSIIKTVKELATKEQIVPVSIRVSDKDKCTTIISKDKKEYLIFKQLNDAKKYAVKTFVKYFDDVEVLQELRLSNMSVDYFGNLKVNKNGAESIISYDTNHKLKLNNGIAYRII